MTSALVNISDATFTPQPQTNGAQFASPPPGLAIFTLQSTANCVGWVINLSDGQTQLIRFPSAGQQMIFNVPIEYMTSYTSLAYYDWNGSPLQAVGSIKWPAGSGGISGLSQDAVAGPNGVTTVHGIETIPVAATTPLAKQALIMGASQYSPASVEPVLHVDTYIAAASGDVAAGINAAFTAFAAASQSRTSPVLVFGSGAYLASSAALICLNANGGTIRGAGISQTVIQPLVAGSPGIQFVNCSHVEIRDICVLPGPVQTALSAAAIAGATAITVTSGAGIVNGQRLGLQNAAETLGEVVTVLSGGGTTSLTVSALRESYALGDTVMHGITAAYQSYSDINQAGGGSTNLTFSTVAWGACMYGIEFACAGGTGSPSDVNNDGHKVIHCKALYTPIANVNIGHSNSLLHKIDNCFFSGTKGIQMLTGGSFSCVGGFWLITGIVFELGGAFGRVGSIVGVVNTDTQAIFIRARQSDNLSYFRAMFFGCMCYGVPGLSGPVIDITGTLMNISFTGCSIAFGGAPTSYSILLKDTAGATLSSYVSFRDCEIGAYALTADGVVVKREGTTNWQAGTLPQLYDTKLHGGQIYDMTCGASDNASVTGPFRVGEIAGYSVSENRWAVTAATYTIGTALSTGGPAFERTTLCDCASAQTITLPVQYRSGRVLEFESGTLSPVTLSPQPSATINGAAALIWQPGYVGARIAVYGDGTNWSSQSSSLQPGQATQALTAGTATLTAAQLAAQVVVFTGSLTGSVTIDFGATTGTYTLNFEQVALGAFGVSVKNGTKTIVATTLLSAFKTSLICSLTTANNLSIG